MIKQLKFTLPLLIFILIGFFLWRGLQRDPNHLPSAFIGKQTPNISLPTLQNPKIILTNQRFKNKVVLLNVWASWCSSCRAEHPFLMDIANQHRVPIYSIDYKDQRGQALQWLHQVGNPYQATGFDPNGSVSIDLGVYGTPETFIIDKKGFIRYRRVGMLSPSIWEETVYPLIQKLRKE